MAAANYWRKRPTISAEQFVVANTPWPDNVTEPETGVYEYDCEAGGPVPCPVPITDTDWVANGKVLSDAQFTARYEIAT